jgi:multiple sugar transport system substrate-binding protein
MKLKYILGATAVSIALSLPAAAQNFNWRAHEGQTINLMLNNHPWSQAMRDLAAEFTAKTGIKTQIEIFNEEQFRARLTTLMQGKSADLDVYMSLTSREGAIFDKAGWYADLAPLMADKTMTMPDFNYEDFSASIRAASTFGNRIVALPINQEGPLFYWRKDVFEKCKVAEPKAVEELPETAKALKACDASMGAWAARGLRGAIPYALTAFINNQGGSYSTPDGKPGLSQPNTLKGLALYASMLKDHGPPGALNHTFTQVIELLGQGRIAMTHESSNEFANIMRFPGRAQDLGVKVLPPGRDTRISKPVAIGWTVTMSPNSQRKPASWYFLQWATSREIQAKLVANGVAPPRASVFEGPEFNTWVAEMPIRKAWADSLIEIGKTGTGVYQSPTERVPEARDIIGTAVQEIVQGASPVDAARKADEALAKLQ